MSAIDDAIREHREKQNAKELYANWCEDCEEWVEEPMMVCRSHDKFPHGKRERIFPHPRFRDALSVAWAELRRQWENSADADIGLSEAMKEIERILEGGE